MEKTQKNLNDYLLRLVDEINDTNNLYGAVERFNERDGIVFFAEPFENYDSLNYLRQLPITHFSVTFVMHDDTLYILKAQKNIDPFRVSAVSNFIILLSIITSLIFMVAYIITYKTIINPIENLEKSIKQYKFGVKPTRTNGNSEIDIVQNRFVDLVDSLEVEKETQTRIIASISHDFKTPITAILGYSDRVVHLQLSREKRMQYLDRIYQKALSMKELTSEFDDYLSHNIKHSLNLEELSVSDLLEEIDNEYRVDLSEQNIDLVVSSTLTKETIHADKSKLKRVFCNTISNSVRFIKGKGTITIKAEKESKYIKFIVGDTGAGVTEENLKTIFEPLFTSDPSRNISGLGLSICQDIIEHHEGIIYAENNEDGGLNIVFTLKRIK